MKVLVTGASGLIGTHMREHLANERSGWEVVGIDRVAPKEEFGEVIERVDLLHADALEEVVRWQKPDAIVHLAAQARVDPSVADPLGTYDLNVVATLNVMKAAKRTGVGQILAASSEAVYGRARTYPSPENNDFAPANPYAASKVAVDVLCQQFDSTIPTCVIRSGMGWGARQNPREQIVGKFIVNALAEKPLRFPADVPEGMHPTRDLNYIPDFCEGVAKAIALRARGVFNLSGGREYTIPQIAELVVKAVGKGEIVEDPSFTYRPNELGFRTHLDISKAARELGHVPQHHLDDGTTLRGVVKWYRDHPSAWAT